MKTFGLILIWIIFPIVLVALSAITIAILAMSQPIQHNVHASFDDTQRVLIEHVQDRMQLLLQANTSLYNLARLLSSTGDVNIPSTSISESKVFPNLFMVYTLFSWVSQISYITDDDSMFSYYHERNQTYAIFSNISNLVNGLSGNNLYRQQVNETNGERFGNATVLPPIQLNESHSRGYVSWGFGWGMDKEQMLFLKAPVDNNGVASLGIGVKKFIAYILEINLHGAHLYLSTQDGHSLAQTGPPDAQYIVKDDIVSVYEDQNLSSGEYVNISCKMDSNGPMDSKILDIWGKSYKLGCASFDVAGIQLVTVVAFPFENIRYIFRALKIIIILLQSTTILALIFASYFILQVFRRSWKQEAFLQANLIRLKDAVQQAERKSMNKSLAFASASHDVRTSLAGISGLIELCRDDVPPQSELDMNLTQMNACASKLLEILNSILDMSKVEAGKMQLEEVEFDMTQVLEESVDMFHVVALKKGLEVIWDPCDFSVLKSLNVKGDCRRLKQILDNLLGNAVKFTSKGHVILRAWAKKPSLGNSVHSSKQSYRFPKFACSKLRWFKKDDAYSDVMTINTSLHDSNMIEFVFEVEDSGLGIPKEKRASIFENYVQVKELSPGGHEGTGLGLGIVQSFVRLMGGEISIEDKEHGEEGTCFRFNIFLKSCEMAFSHTEEENKYSHNQEASNQPTLRAMAFRKPFKMEGVHSLLLIESNETKRILQRWMENIGMKVWIVQNWELLYPMLEKCKLTDSGSGKFDALSRGNSLNKVKSLDIVKDMSRSPTDETNHILPLSTKQTSRRRSRDSCTLILAVIDINCGDFSNICSILNNFSKDNQRTQLKTVWLVNANTQSAELRRLKQKSYDLILRKPIHGSRLYEMSRLMQDLVGRSEIHPSTSRSQDTTHISHIPPLASQSIPSVHKLDIEKPLADMKILLVEDNILMRRIASSTLSRFGAMVEFAENGLEALNLIKKALKEDDDYNESNRGGALKSFPYDVVLMDCEMPIMNGYEATKKIREEEKFYGIHIPIVALTAHATSEEEKKAILSGMDSYLTKPINAERVIEAIRLIRQN
ncbi:uncharacterized protein A4U43_C06F2050 [Asparagus officinalis]|uniref:histidine kinase n=1 Tax=Asparagus officinalis TaxID=4686 RepID=A0A5P1EIY3_ASPOF|nr:probable histidine kinase 2 [Asparagus officinalis]ONK65892.1 uncharacterized protein A4U43_C06F2050 [Asparagus officinalis]